jgi:hypothetical protein
MKQQFSGSPILEISAIFCAKNFRLPDEGLCTEGRKDHKDLMVVEREACVEASVRQEAAILCIPPQTLPVPVPGERLFIPIN